MSNVIDKMKVARYLTQQIDICGKSQKDIAEEVGYPMPNVITMFKQGKTRLPLNKVPLFAKSLGVDAAHLLRITMSSYMPETWEVIEEIVGKSIVSEDENKVLDIIRRVGLGYRCVPETVEEQREFAALALKWRQREEKSADAARRRVLRDRTGKEGEADAPLETDLDVLLGFKE